MAYDIFFKSVGLKLVYIDQAAAKPSRLYGKTRKSRSKTQNRPILSYEATGKTCGLKHVA